MANETLIKNCIKQLKNDEDPRVRAVAISLGYLTEKDKNNNNPIIKKALAHLDEYKHVLSCDEDENIRAIIATHPDMQRQYVTDPSYIVRVAVARTTTDPEVIDALCNDPNEQVRIALAKRGIRPFSSDSEKIRAIIASFGYEPNKFAKDPYPMVVASAIPYITDDIILQSVYRRFVDNETVCIALAKRGYALSLLQHHPSPIVRMEVAKQNVRIDQLAFDTEERVRAIVAQKNNTLGNLQTDTSPIVRMGLTNYKELWESLLKKKSENPYVKARIIHHMLQEDSNAFDKNQLEAFAFSSKQIRIILAIHNKVTDILRCDPNDNVRRIVARYETDTKTLCQMTNDKNYLVRIEVLKKLHTLINGESKKEEVSYIKKLTKHFPNTPRSNYDTPFFCPSAIGHTNHHCCPYHITNKHCIVCWSKTT